MKIYGYCRVSTKEQKKDGFGLEVQRKQILEKYENAEIVEEAYTGTTMDRPKFSELISKLKSGDLLVVARLDRFARTTVEGIKTVEGLFKKGVAIHILNVGYLDDTPMGRFFLTTMLAVAELERNMIVERTQNGKAAARQKEGYVDGRPPKWSEEEIMGILEHLSTHSYAITSKELGVSKSSLIRMRRKYGVKKSQYRVVKISLQPCSNK